MRGIAKASIGDNIACMLGNLKRWKLSAYPAHPVWLLQNSGARLRIGACHVRCSVQTWGVSKRAVKPCSCLHELKIEQQRFWQAMNVAKQLSVESLKVSCE